ncbi:DUF2306 domain-containing protein [Oceanobacillus sp. J11TS1]|uniref:DUF2306 domain-containing protein n=1 Tax=Oceanobacillus sp. J11TS1 TaxID=2807191 RepID=UPI001BB454A8|nr:DUF2306 domain-containing protein [Oceanobacillus sp. J11TS1]
MFSFFIFIHIIAGFIALITLWMPLFFRKGGTYHRITGWIFTYSMFIISATSIYLSLYRISLDESQTTAQFSFSIFLIFIAILSFSTATYGLRVLQFKKHAGKHRHALDWFIPILLFTSATVMSIYGFLLGDPLLSWFPMIGIFLSISYMLYWWRNPRFKNNWLIEHLTGMLSCGISTVTAFVVFGAPRIFGLNESAILLWFAPTIILVPLIIYFSIKYNKKAVKLN